MEPIILQRNFLNPPRPPFTHPLPGFKPRALICSVTSVSVVLPNGPPAGIVEKRCGAFEGSTTKKLFPRGSSTPTPPVVEPLRFFPPLGRLFRLEPERRWSGAKAKRTAVAVQTPRRSPLPGVTSSRRDRTQPSLHPQVAQRHLPREMTSPHLAPLSFKPLFLPSFRIRLSFEAGCPGDAGPAFWDQIRLGVNSCIVGR